MEATGTNLQTLDLPSTTAAERAAHAEMMLNLQAKKIANTVDVPTLPHHVQNALRNIGQPIRLFGEFGGIELAELPQTLISRSQLSGAMRQ